MQWNVENVVLTRRGEVPLSQLTPEERRRLAENIYLAVARVLAPEGVEVRRVRVVPVGGAQVEPAVRPRPAAGS